MTYAKQRMVFEAYRDNEAAKTPTYSNPPHSNAIQHRALRAGCLVPRGVNEVLYECSGECSGCELKQYFVLGHGNLTRQVSDSCQSGVAVASSSASLNANLIAMATAGNTAVASSGASAAQTATLIAPKGFAGRKVTFKYSDAYAMQLSGIGGTSTGLVQTCLVMAQLSFSECHQQTSNGTDGGTFHGEFVLAKSSTGFQLTMIKSILVDMQGTGATPPPPPAFGSAITTAVPHLILPNGWTCKYDSGTSCP